MQLAIHAARTITPADELRDVVVGVDAGKIVSIEPYRNGMEADFDTFIDARDQTLVPGYIDLQVNGGLSHDFKAEDASIRREIYRFFLSRGTTTLLPTLVTDRPDALESALARLADDVERADPSLPNLPGVHLEGPFLHPDRKGAHREDFLRQPDLELARRFWQAARGRIAIFTLAPELDGADAIIRGYAEQGAVVSAGHTTASREELLRACDAGVSMITHMGNVSDWPHRRKNALGIFASEPGVVGTFMIDGRLRGSIIMDGYHFAPELACALARLRGPESIALISDASYTAGCPPGDYDDGVVKTTVHPDGFAYATGGGGFLAGSIVTMQEVVKIAVQRGGIPLRDAIEMATLTPARILRLENRLGRIAPGCVADLALLDADLNVRRVIRAGSQGS